MLQFWFENNLLIMVPLWMTFQIRELEKTCEKLTKSKKTQACIMYELNFFPLSFTIGFLGVRLLPTLRNPYWARGAARLCVSKITPPSPSASWRPSSSHAATQSFARRSGSERTRPWRGVCLRTIVKLGGLIRLMHGNITFIISPLHCLRSSHL